MYFILFCFIIVIFLKRACYHIRKDMEENKNSNASDKMNEVYSSIIFSFFISLLYQNIY